MLEVQSDVLFGKLSRLEKVTCSKMGFVCIPAQGLYDQVNHETAYILIPFVCS
jgi:hypothetical protein